MESVTSAVSLMLPPNAQQQIENFFDFSDVVSS